MTITDEMQVKAIGDASEADQKLKRRLSFQDLFFISLGAVIGSGWLFASLDSASVAGPASILSWMIGAVLIIFIGLNYAELAGMIPRTGAISRYPHLSHGSFTGFFMGWAYLIGASAGPAIEAEAVAEYTGTYIPRLVQVSNTYAGQVTVLTLSGLGLALLLMMLFFLLNYYGVKALGRVNTIVSWPFKIVIPLITFVFLLFIFHSTNFTFASGFIPYGVGSIFLAIPTTGIIFSYLGFRQALEYSGEAISPRKDVPKALIASVLVSLLIYTLLEIGFVGAVNWSKIGVLAGNWAALKSSSLAVGPLYEIFRQSGVAALASFGVFLLAESWVAPGSSGWIYLGNSTRTFYGLSANGYLAKFLLKISKRGIPIFSLIVGTIAGIIYLLPFPSWYLLVGLMSATSLFTYTMGGVTLQVLRRHAPKIKRLFRLPFASIFAPLGFLSGDLVVYWSGFITVYYAMTAILIGLPLYIIFYVLLKEKANRNISITLAVLYWVFLILDTIFLFESVILPYTKIIDIQGTTMSLAQANGFAISFVEYYVVLILILISTMITLSIKLLKRNNKQITAGYWLVIFVASFFPISFFGSFGVYLPKGIAVLPFPWDTLIAALIGLGVYFYAVHSGYKTPEIENLIVTNNEDVSEQ